MAVDCFVNRAQLPPEKFKIPMLEQGSFKNIKSSEMQMKKKSGQEREQLLPGKDKNIKSSEMHSDSSMIQV